MTRSTKLNDLQRVLLSTASQRDDRALLPATDINIDPQRLRAALASLERRGLAIHMPTTEPIACWQTQADTMLTLVISDAGLAAVGADGEETDIVPDPAAATAAPFVSASPPKPISKQATVIALLTREKGATLGQMIDVTGWLPHTTRAALTGLKKRGYVIMSDKIDGVRTYRANAPELEAVQ